MRDIREIWSKALERLREILTEDSFQRWISNITPVRMEEERLVLGVPSSMFVDWLTCNYKELIEEAIRKATALKLKVCFESGHDVELPPEDVLPEIPEEEPQESAHLPGQVQPESTFGLDKRYTFDSFVIGENNRMAMVACQAVAAKPGENVNPLFIYSGTGLGKTHLLQGIAQYVLSHNPKANVMYINTEDFANQFVDAMLHRSLPAFRNRFRYVDVLLMDDVQFLGRKEAFQEELFHTFNALYNAHKQIVMTSDRQPHEIPGLEKRLVSRFEWGLSVEIYPPELETRIAIIRKKQEDQQYKLSEEVIQYVAARLKSNVRRLESAVTKLVSWASLTGMKIDVAATERLLSDVFSEESGNLLSVEDIQRVVAEYYDIRMSDIIGNRRPANIAVPRQVAMYFARKMTELSLPSIGEKFNRNHTTVFHAISAVEEKEKSSEEFKRELAQIERKLKSF